jgi:hypothetical protein
MRFILSKKGIELIFNPFFIAVNVIENGCLNFNGLNDNQTFAVNYFC